MSATPPASELSAFDEVMTPRFRLFTHLAPLLILLIGIGATIGLTRDLDRRAAIDLESDLQRDAAELALVFQGLASSFQSEMAAVTAITMFGGGDPAIHRDYILDHQVGGAHGLVDLSGERPVLRQVVHATASPTQVEADAADLQRFIQDPMVIASLEAAKGGPSGLTFLVAGDDSRAIAAVASDGETSVADILPFDFGSAGLYLVDQIGSAAEFAIYLSDSPDPVNALMASTPDLPLRGSVAAETMQISSQPLYIEVGGRASPDLPPRAIGLIGALLSFLLAGSFHLALRRRDAAIDALAMAERAESDRAKMEADLHHAQRMESIGQLAGGIAHDFNNILAAIAATAELVAGDVEDARTIRDVEEILDATRRGATLTRRLLSFSRRDVSPGQVVDVNAVATDLERLLQRTIGEQIDLEVHKAESPLSVLGDPSEIEQVLLNLAVNARDAADGRGHQIRLVTRRVGDHAEIVVADTGRGMEEDVRDRAFEPFFTTKPADQGTGLGLSIVYGIVTRMGGTVHIDSTLGRGTTITIEIPLADTGDGGATEGSAERIADRQRDRLRVLLVEDEPAVRGATVRLIERAGHDVTAVGDGLAAIDAVACGFVPDVVLTDVVLPGDLTGRDVADAMRTVLPGVHIIYASGYSRDMISADQLEAEGARFVAKPFTARALLGAIEAARAVVSS